MLQHCGQAGVICVVVHFQITLVEAFLASYIEQRQGPFMYQETCFHRDELASLKHICSRCIMFGIAWVAVDGAA